MKNHVIVNDYKHNTELRASFCNLGKKTFGIDFEDYYQSGFWKNEYNPYSVIINEEVVASISVNKMTMYENGVKHNLIQLGTVMTDDRYQNQGMSRALMEEILNTYKDAEGIYLFANNTVLDFYPKFGFRKAEQYCLEGSFTGGTQSIAIKVPMTNYNDWNAFADKISEYRSISSFAFDSIDLYMFYLTSFMKDNLYYIEETDSYVVAEINEEVLNISEIWTRNGCITDIEYIFKAFGNKVNYVKLGFAYDNTKLSFKKYVEEDLTLFVMGKWFDDYDNKKLIFPLLTHA